MALVLFVVTFFLLGIVSIAVIMNHFVPLRDVHVVRPGRYRELTQLEQQNQHTPGMLYCTVQPIEISFLHEGRRQHVTIPINVVFHGTSLKQWFGVDSYADAWIMRDWLYTKPHALDSGLLITSRKCVDEIMYEQLSHDGVCGMVYASLLSMFDCLVTTTLNQAWEDDAACPSVSPSSHP
jgi:hypothetical protein